MARRPRAAAKAAAQSMRSEPAPISDDEEMRNTSPPASMPAENPEDAEKASEEPATEEIEGEGDGAGDGDADGTEHDAAQQSDHENQDNPDSASAAGTPQVESEAQSRAGTPSQTPGRVSAIPRKRRIGRPPKIKPPDWDAPDTEATARDASTPARRRGRGRPSAGGRWARSRGGPSHLTQMPVDKDGNVMNIVNDEVELPTDAEGETKVDDMGNLLGDREYRVRIFTIQDKGPRQYMLSTEPARCMGFRDSYLFFQKHRMLFKIIIDDDAKRDLIDRGIIPHSYKGRAIGVVTARSVFREFGSKIVIGGRKIIDDYYVQAARERGDVEGQIAVPEDRLPPPGLPYNKNQYVAWHGASAVYHSGVPSVPLAPGKVLDQKKRRVVVTGDNWMLEHARAASQFNSKLTAARVATNEGQYEVHTNLMHYPRNMQPTRARWEPLPPPEEDEKTQARLVDSAARVLDNGNTPAPSRGEDEKQTTLPSSSSTIFPPVPAVFSRNLAIHDIYYESPESQSYGLPLPTPDVQAETVDRGSSGLISIRTDGTPYYNLPVEVLAELPEDRLAAYSEAAVREYEWKMRWKGEKVDGARARIHLNYVWHP